MYFGFGAACNPKSPKALDPNYFCNEKTGRWNKRPARRGTRRARSSRKRQGDRPRRARTKRRRNRTTRRPIKRRRTRARKGTRSSTRVRQGDRPPRARARKPIRITRRQRRSSGGVPNINTLLSPRRHTYDDEKILRYIPRFKIVQMWTKYMKKRYDICTTGTGVIFSIFEGISKIMFFDIFELSF